MEFTEKYEMDMFPFITSPHPESLMGFLMETIQLMNLLVYLRFLAKTLIFFYKHNSYQQRGPKSFPCFRNPLAAGSEDHLGLLNGAEYAMFKLGSN